MKTKLLEVMNQIVSKFQNNKIEQVKEDWMEDDYDPDFDEETNFDYEFKDGVLEEVEGEDE